MDYLSLIAFAETMPSWLSLPLSFFSPMVGGELGVMAVAFVAAQGIFSVWVVILGSTLGMLVLDTFWFFAARTKMFYWFKEKVTRNSKNFVVLEKKIERVSNGRDMLILMISKVLVGTRILIILYISGKKITYGRFMMYDAPPTLLWAGMLSGLGYVAGRVSYNLFHVYENTALALGFIVLFAVAIYLLLQWIRVWFTKKNSKSN